MQVLLAVGRDACTADLGLEHAGVTVNPNGKISTKHEATNRPHVYALGDVVDGSPLPPLIARTAEVGCNRMHRRLQPQCIAGCNRMQPHAE